MSRREEALRLLAGREAAGAEFFRIAAKALVSGLGCRWAGFARPSSDGTGAEVFAFWGGDGQASPFHYPLAGTACQAVCLSQPDRAYHFHGRLQSAACPRGGRRIAAAWHSYRGEAIFADDGRLLGHVFAVGDSLVADAAEDRDLFRLVAARAGAELARLGARAAGLQAQADSETANRTKTGYFVHMADAMRTPLNAVIGFAEVLQEMPEAELAGGRGREYAEEIRAIGAHMRRLVDDVHLLAKVEGGELRLAEEPVDLNHVARDCAALVQARATEQGVALSTGSRAPSLPVLADAGLLRRLTLKLLANAIQFTPAGGQVTVTVGVGAHGGPELRIVDTGVGMRPEEIAAVLVPFRRPSSLDAGSGLGLPLANALCALHQGSLEITSAPGTGTTVAVRLPVGRWLRGTGAGLRNVA